jgi:hypothetical protein
MGFEATLGQIEDKGGILVGPYRAPRNLGNNVEGSIHDDKTAQNLGFRGGTVAGSIHMEQLPPLMLAAFGPGWFEQGTLSCYFRNATTDGESVRGLVRKPTTGKDEQVDVWMEREDGMTVLEGTASGARPTEQSMVRQRLSRAPAPEDVRILSKLKVGQELPAVPARLESSSMERRMSVITEPCDWYTGGSPWGGPIAHPGAIVRLMRATEQGVRRGIRGAVGLFGAIEIAHLNGPVFMDHDYEIGGKIIAIGETPKSEYYAYEAVAREPGGGKEVALMIMMLRFMKASSPLWTEAAPSRS